NGKCPIQQHEHCEFSQVKTAKKLVSELLVICPRQFDLTKEQLNGGIKSGEEGEPWNESNPNLNLNLNLNSKNNCNCDYKGKIKDLKDHLDKSCNLIPTKQSIPYEIINQLNAMNGQIKELQNVVKDLQLQLKDVKDKDNEKDKQIEQTNKQINDLKVESLKKEQQVIQQIDNLKHELQEKDETITALTNNIQQFKMDNIEFKKQLNQFEMKFDQYKQNIETKVENQTTNIQQLQTQFEQEQKNEQKEREQDISELKYNKNCQHMVSFLTPFNLKNGVDFLLVNENKQTIKLKNNEWNNYNFGIFLLGENITITLNCNDLGHLKIKTSHLWIKHSSSKIDCSQLGYPTNQGPGKGEHSGGGGYGTKGKGNNGSGGEMYGEKNLLKQIHFGSGGGSAFNYIGGSGGGIIELIIEQQLTNHGSIQSNGRDGWNGDGGGSGGSILIELQYQYQSHLNKLKQTFGTITCIGGNRNNGMYKGGKGRIAIYGIELSSDDILEMDPKPFNRLHK
ncbi:hypothetical protein RFI_37150, partial [Reticulomyxa filosa]